MRLVGGAPCGAITPVGDEAFVRCGAWCSAATRGVSLLVCCFRHGEYKSVLFPSWVTNIWRFVGVTNYVALRRGYQICGVL